MQPALKQKRTFFISRTGADKDWAQWIAQELEAAAHSAIVQDWDSRPGKSFIEFMRKGAHETILVMSPEYWNAVYTQPEWEAAFLANAVIPVRVRECQIPNLVRRLAFIDLVGKTRDEARQEVLDGIRRDRVKREVDFPGGSGEPTISVAKLPAVNPLLVGREPELKQLDEAWTDPAIRLVSICKRETPHLAVQADAAASGDTFPSSVESTDINWRLPWVLAVQASPYVMSLQTRDAHIVTEASQGIELAGRCGNSKRAVQLIHRTGYSDLNWRS